MQSENSAWKYGWILKNEWMEPERALLNEQLNISVIHVYLRRFEIRLQQETQ